MARRKRRRLRTVWRALVVLAAAGFACAAYIYLTLPDVRVLRTENPQTTAFMELRAQQAIAEGQPLRKVHRWVPYSRISQNLTRAVLVAEDSAFWQHEGVDFKQLQESMEINLERMEFYRGASTITQQLAKNLYLSPSRNPLRKVKELFIARRLEAALTKQRIFEIYLNVIEWGDGIFGCEAAAQAYFNKPCASLAMAEAALMAGAIINPREHNPARPTRRLLRRQQITMRRMGFKEEPPAPMPPPPALNETPVEIPIDTTPVPQPFPLPPGNTSPGALPPRNGTPNIVS
jgi:monofunctional biosynthetic peptidoglycan transglycosylase